MCNYQPFLNDREHHTFVVVVVVKSFKVLMFCDLLSVGSFQDGVSLFLIYHFMLSYWVFSVSFYQATKDQKM